jgi:hypothetical protein
MTVNKSKDRAQSTIWQLPANFPLDDLTEVGAVLEAADILVPGYGVPDVGMYHPAGHLYANSQGVTTWILPDRNVASRIAQLAKGRETAGDRQLCLCAGLLGFAQVMGIQFEASASYHELAHNLGNQVAQEELGWFRAADKAPFQDMLNVALGRSDGVSGSYTPQIVAIEDMARPIFRWNRNYIVALKILELDLGAGRAVDKALRLLDWMADRLIFAGPAMMLASIYLGTHSPSKKKVFKNKGSADRAAAIAGVKNAAWDITHLSDFVKRVNESHVDGSNQYLFATFDTHLMKTARFLMQVGLEGTTSSVLAEGLSQWWGERDACVIADAIAAHLKRINAPGHEPRTSTDPEFIPKLIAEGERRVIEAI